MRKTRTVAAFPLTITVQPSLDPLTVNDPWAWAVAVRPVQQQHQTQVPFWSQFQGTEFWPQTGVMEDFGQTYFGQPNVHISGPLRFKHHQNSTRRHPERHNESETVAGKGRKSAKFWAPQHLGFPSGPHPSGPHPSGQVWPKSANKVGQSRNWPKSANKDGQSRIGQSRSQPRLVSYNSGQHHIRHLD